MTWSDPLVQSKNKKKLHLPEMTTLLLIFAVIAALFARGVYYPAWKSSYQQAIAHAIGVYRQFFNHTVAEVTGESWS